MKRVVVAATIAAAVIGGATACGSDTDSQASDPKVTDTTSAPDQVRWEQWQGVAVPVSEVDGPRKIEGAVASGYSDTPQGAVLAAAQAVTRLRLAPDDAWPQVANTVAAPGRGRDQYAVNRVQVSITGPVPSGTVDALRGFKIGEYSDERATVELVTEQTGAPLTASTHTVIWTGDDWKLALPDRDADAPAPKPVDSLDGYTRFEAQQ
ncbi:hypothetical protein GS500_23125 [Rhodococcus hoagii]|nr:hypothetical protein [Prescottella equi]